MTVNHCTVSGVIFLSSLSFLFYPKVRFPFYFKFSGSKYPFSSLPSHSPCFSFFPSHPAMNSSFFLTHVLLVTASCAYVNFVYTYSSPFFFPFATRHNTFPLVTYFFGTFVFVSAKEIPGRICEKFPVSVRFFLSVFFSPLLEGSIGGYSCSRSSGLN